jgi:signal peptidase II
MGGLLARFCRLRHRAESRMSARMSHRLTGLAAAALVFAADQAGKIFMLMSVFNFDLAGDRAIPLSPWLDLILTFNPGISYSLFSAESTAGWLALLGFTAAAVLALTVWLWRTRSFVGAVALGAIIGGALGNGCDRAIHRKVVDFIHFHIGAFSPFGVFNIADMAIFAGVALLLYSEFFLQAPAAQDSAASKSP